MGLFDRILDAINTPEREGSSNQLSNIIDTVQKLSRNYSANSEAIESAMSIVGRFTRSALQEKRSADGEREARQIIDRFGGTEPNERAIDTLFNQPQLQQMILEITNRTGIDSQTVKGLLPILVPLVLDFLKTGTNSKNFLESNSVLKSFLDADGDGDVDIYDAMQMAKKHLNR